jgi:hypothetical protein
MFEFNFRDERYLPFEGAGVISDWMIELSTEKELRQFDYSTISDAILHVKYTAREDAGVFKNGAVAHLRDYFSQDGATHSLRMFNLRHEFPTEWARFKSVQIEHGGLAELTLNLREEHYPFWSRGRLDTVRRVDLFAKPTQDTSVVISDQPDGTRNEDELVRDISFGDLMRGNLTNIPLPAPIGEFTQYLDDNSMEELWLAVTWGKAD